MLCTLLYRRTQRHKDTETQNAVTTQNRMRYKNAVLQNDSKQNANIYTVHKTLTNI